MLAGIEQESVPRGLYVACEKQTPIPGRLADEHIVRMQRQGMTVPGFSRRRSGYAVTIEATIAITRSESVTIRMIIPVVTDARGLAWILHADRFDAYRRGHCLQQRPPA